MGDGLGATKTRLFGKKSGGTPNPQVKKVGGTPNPDEISRRPPPCAAPAGGGDYILTRFIKKSNSFLHFYRKI